MHHAVFPGVVGPRWDASNIGLGHQQFPQTQHEDFRLGPTRASWASWTLSAKHGMMLMR
jgi:hypothetical protein